MKSYANTFIYTKLNDKGDSIEKELVMTITSKGNRINKDSEAFKQVLNEVKIRQTTSVLYRVLMMSDTVLLMSPNKELPASFKVFAARDLGDPEGKKPVRVFIDCTGLIELKNGLFTCRHIDKLCAYLMAAMIQLIYAKDSNRITTNANIVRSSVVCYTKMFTGVLDSLRVINFMENKQKISYIASNFFLYNLMEKDISSSRNLSANINSISQKEANAWDYYYNETEDFRNIDSLVTILASTFKLNGLTTDIYLNRWIWDYGKSSLYASEFLPAFLTNITHCYSGSYINNQKAIETICGKEMVNLSTALIRLGGDMFDKGFMYESNTRDDLVAKSLK